MPDLGPALRYQCHRCRYYIAGECGPTCDCRLELDDPEHVGLHRLQLLLLDGRLNDAIVMIAELQPDSHDDEPDDWWFRWDRLTAWPALVRHRARVHRLIERWTLNANATEAAYAALAVGLPEAVVRIEMEAQAFPEGHIDATARAMQRGINACRHRWAPRVEDVLGRFEEEI